MLKEKAVYGNEGWGGRAGVQLYQAHNPQNRSMVTPPKTSHGRGEYTFKEDLQLRLIARRVKHLFYDWYDKARYQHFMWDTHKCENASFPLLTSWLILKSLKCDISVEFKVEWLTRLDSPLNIENYDILNIYDESTLNLRGLSWVRRKYLHGNTLEAVISKNIALV